MLSMGVRRGIVIAGEACRQMPEKRPLCYSGNGQTVQAAQTIWPLIFGEELCRRHYAERMSMLWILLDLVTGSPQSDGETQRQPIQGERRDTSAAL